MLVEEPERAVALLALAQQLSPDLTGWMAHCPPLAYLRQQLDVTLGEERFAAAWERRARHDLDPAVDTLLADLASG